MPRIFSPFLIAAITAYVMLFCPMPNTLPSCAGQVPDQQDTRTSVIVDVTTYGADPTGHQDSGPAIRRAVAALPNHATLLFPAGRYRIASPEPRYPTIAIRIHRRNNIVIAAESAGAVELSFEGIMKQFAVSRCNNITFRGLQNTMNPLPWVSGSVASVQPKSVIVNLNSAWPTAYGLSVQAILVVDPQTGASLPFAADLPWGWCNKHVQEVSLTGNVLTINFDTSTRLKAGQTVIITIQKFSNVAYFFKNSNNIILEDVTVNAAAGLGFTAFECINVTLKNFSVLPEQGKLFSTCAAATHFRNCRGELLIVGGQWANMGDDGTNIRGTWARIKATHNERIVLRRPDKGQWVVPQTGDILRLSNDQWEIGGDYVVARVGRKSASEVLVTLDSPPPLGFDWVENRSARPTNVHIEGVTISNARARGAVVQTDNVLIRDCRFEGLAEEAILITTDRRYFGEAGPANHINIRDNQIINCNLHGTNFLAPISARLDYVTDPQVPATHGTIEITGNLIDGSAHNLISIQSAAHAIIRNNVLKNPNQYPRGITPGFPGIQAAIRISQTSKATIADNDIHDTIAMPVCVGQNVATVRGNQSPQATDQLVP
jgi:hypothetical protein